MKESLVRVENLSHRYTIQWAVKDVSFEIPTRRIYGLLVLKGAGKALTTNSKLLFKKQPSFMDGGVPTYTYRLQDGLSDDRQGMFILRNEGILDDVNVFS